MLEKFFIVRTAWVFGLHGKNFVKTMIEAGKHRSEVRVVNDQIQAVIPLQKKFSDLRNDDKFSNGFRGANFQMKLICLYKIFL